MEDGTWEVDRGPRADAKHPSRPPLLYPSQVLIKWVYKSVLGRSEPLIAFYLTIIFSHFTPATSCKPAFTRAT